MRVESRRSPQSSDFVARLETRESRAQGALPDPLLAASCLSQRSSVTPGGNYHTAGYCRNRMYQTATSAPGGSSHQLQRLTRSEGGGESRVASHLNNSHTPSPGCVGHIFASYYGRLPTREGVWFAGTPTMRIQLTRKLADKVNGVDLSKRSVGDIFELPQRAAQILLDEGWAALIDRRGAADRRKPPELKKH